MMTRTKSKPPARMWCGAPSPCANTTRKWRCRPCLWPALAATLMMHFTTDLLFAGVVVYPDDLASYDPSDATAAIQEAIDLAGGHTVQFRAQTPYLVAERLRVWNRSSIDLIFEEGAVLEAKPGAYDFHSPEKSALMSINQSGNINVRGLGSGGGTFRGLKDDYLGQPHPPGGRPFNLHISASDGVTVENMSFIDGGQDGIYITGSGGIGGGPFSSNITLRDVIADNNARNGLSVISVDGLTVENSQFNNSSGMAPQYGIDLEPNSPTDRLSNIVLDGITLANNAEGGLGIAPNNLHFLTPPLSITARNISIEGGADGMSIYDDFGYKFNVGVEPVTGNITLENVEIRQTSDVGFWIQNYTQNATGSAMGIQMTDIRLIDTATDITVPGVPQRAGAPIIISGGRNSAGVTMHDVYVEDDIDRPFLFATPLARLRGITNLTGSFNVDNPNGAFWQLGDNLTNVNITITPGDLNIDGVADDLDIDLLREAIAMMSTEIQFDLNGDTFIDNEDVIFLLTDILDTSIADVTLDKVVDAEDLAIIRANIGATGAGILPWSQGNVIGDGVIDEIDVLASRFHFGFENLTAAPSIPEPATIMLLICAWYLCPLAGVNLNHLRRIA